MPSRPPHPCTTCGTFTVGACGDCRRAAARARQRRRGTRQQLGYTAEYQRNRRQVLAGHPACHWCGVAPATVTDHVVPLSQGGSNELGNLVPSCVPCNARRITKG